MLALATTALSERVSSSAESLPADAAGAGLQSRQLGQGSGRFRQPLGLRIHVRSGWDLHPQDGFRRSPVFGTGAVGLSASRSSAESERFELPRRSSRPTPLPTVPLVPSGHSPCAEGERIERPRGSRPDLRLATGCLTSSASLPYAGRDLHPHAPSGTRASEARASALRHQRLEWPARFELALRPWQGRVLPLTLRPHGASGEIRTHDLRLTEAALCPLELQRQRSGSRTRTCVRRFQGPAGLPATHPGMEPSPGADPGLPPYRGRVTAVCDGKARSRHPVPTRGIRHTKAEPQPCAAA
jgi:hypothetical protein